jgi:hypothetical protein
MWSPRRLSGICRQERGLTLCINLALRSLGCEPIEKTVLDALRHRFRKHASPSIEWIGGIFRKLRPWRRQPNRVLYFIIRQN